MCQKLHCLTNNTGHGYSTCEHTYIHAIAAGRNNRPYFEKDLKFAYHVCACECNVLFFRHHGKSLVTQSQKASDDAIEKTAYNGYFLSFY